MIENVTQKSNGQNDVLLSNNTNAMIQLNQNGRMNATNM